MSKSSTLRIGPHVEGSVVINEFEWNHEYVDLPGLRMHYVRHGQGMPIILQHGWPEFWYVWRKNIPALSEHFGIMVPDLRGFGDSEKSGKCPRRRRLRR